MKKLSLRRTLCPSHYLALLIYIFLIATTLSPAYGQSEPNLRLLFERDTFTVIVLSQQPISVVGLQFRFLDSQNQPQTIIFEDAFPAIKLADGMVSPGACYIYELQGTNDVLPNSCQNPNKVFRIAFDESDIFWYDFIGRRLRDILIVKNGQPTGDICSAATVSCSINFLADPAPATQEPDTSTIVPPSNPPALPATAPTVTTNREWTPVVQTFNSVDMVQVPPGCFEMGVNGEGGKQCFQSFWFDRFEVTNGVFDTLGGRAVKSSHWANANRPRETITWGEALAFCRLRSARLPSEAEWEYAARGPDDLIYPWGNVFGSENVVYRGNSNATVDFPDGQTAPIDTNRGDISWMGAYDLSGNVREWTNSQFQSYPYRNDGREITEVLQTVFRVVRGSSYGDNLSRNAPEYDMSTMSRGKQGDLFSADYQGFRCVRDF